MLYHRHAGLAMPDVLVALVLLAIALTGACATLIQSLRATHEALLTGRAVDLANDLAEQMHRTDPEAVQAVLQAWREGIGTVLPVEGLALEQVASLQAVDPNPAEPVSPFLHELILRWHARSAGGVRELRLPLLLPAQEATT